MNILGGRCPDHVAKRKKPKNEALFTYHSLTSQAHHG
jgi:hypothetical protein